MRSIKRGRGPSLMGGVMGLVAAVFGVFWTAGAASAGAPKFMVLFGVVFIFVALFGSATNIYNTVAKNRLSEYDLTGPGEEVDPIAHALGHEPKTRVRHTHEPRVDPETAARRGEQPPGYDGGFCPYCGVPVKDDFEFCPSCGKDI